MSKYLGIAWLAMAAVTMGIAFLMNEPLWGGIAAAYVAIGAIHIDGDKG